MHKCVWETLCWQRPMCFLLAGLVRPFNRQVDIVKPQDGSEIMQCFQDSTSESFLTKHLEVHVGKLVSCSSTFLGMWIAGMLVKMQIPKTYHWGQIWKFRQSGWSLESAPCLMLLVCRQFSENHSLEAGVLVSFRAALAMDLLRTSEDKGWLRNQVSQGTPQTCMNEWMREWINEMS